MEALVRVLMDSRRNADIVRRAISVDEKPGRRSSLEVGVEGESIVLRYSALDLGALRAALNSSLREVKVASEAML